MSVVTAQVPHDHNLRLVKPAVSEAFDEDLGLVVLQVAFIELGFGSFAKPVDELVVRMPSRPAAHL